MPSHATVSLPAGYLLFQMGCTKLDMMVTGSLLLVIENTAGGSQLG